MAYKSEPYIDYPGLREKYDSKCFSPGQRADLRKSATPEDLLLRPAYYTLMGGNINDGYLKVAFMLPWIKHKEGAGGLGRALAKAGANEKRLFQVLRSRAPNDLIQLRRLVQHSEPVADWRQVGKMLYFWTEDQHDLSHRMLLEQYYSTSSESEFEEYIEKE